MRERSKVSSIARSTLMGRIVDSYTNILTVKLFARAHEEDQYVRNAVDRHVDLFTNIAAPAHRVRRAARRAQRAADRRLGRAGAGAVALRRRRGRRHRHGAAADPAAHQHVAADRHAHYRNLRGSRRGAGRHADHRAAAATARSRRRAAADRARRPHRFQERQLRLRPRDRRAAEFQPDDPTRREDRPGRPLRRRQIDRGQSAAALLPSRRRRHPHRWR